MMRIRKRGFCGIGIYLPKYDINIGGLWRSAFAFNADFIFTIGEKYEHEAQDTCRAPRHLPLFTFRDADDFFAHRPEGASVVGIELTPDAVCLHDFVHPTRAVYVLGRENSGLPQEVLSRCDAVVQIPTPRVPCLNVVTAGSIVLYDRFVKLKSRSAVDRLVVFPPVPPPAAAAAAAVS
jgi:tRNA G18 (ribose-2'-O)-methylase SpoU